MYSDMVYEVMAPVGSRESLAAAIQAGADSIYFGIERLNMRAHSASTFTIDDLRDIASQCDVHGIKSYLTVNTIIYGEDIPLMHQIIDAAKEAGISAVIASDVAVMTYCNKVGQEVHLSTQLNISNIEALRFYAQFADVVVLARELNMEQVADIYRQVEEEHICGPSGEQIRIEMFCHGALCMAVSGKCYMSLHAANRSANRGECIQVCRRSYTATDNETGYQLDIDNKYIMSPKDLKTIRFIDRMMKAGVRVFKIEGRARGPEYVYTVVKCYKEAIQAVLDGTFTEERKDEWDERLATVFNRGFWDGYYQGQLMGEWNKSYGSNATERKVYIGKGTKYYSKLGVAEFTVEADTFQVGDKMLVTGPTTGVIYVTADEIHDDDGPVEVARQGTRVSIAVPSKVRPSDKLFKLVKACIVACLLALTGLTAQAQSLMQDLKDDVNRSAGLNYALPIEKKFKDTPAPQGKKPFYINHYSCPSPYYLHDPAAYEAPYAVFARADSLDKLTRLGRDVKRRLELLRQDAHDRLGEVTAKGAAQSRALMRQLMERFPEAFDPKGYYSGRSVVKNHCIVTMQEAMIQLSASLRPLIYNTRATHTENSFMDPQDKQLTSKRVDSLTLAHYRRFCALNAVEGRLMESLFNDQNYVIRYIDPTELSRQLFVLAGTVQHTGLAGTVTLYDIFDAGEIHRHWKMLNAWNYINYGACEMNGGHQPYLQRAVLRNMIHMGDSAVKRYTPISHLRYTHEHVVLSLACLMELDDCGLETDNLDALEENGWADYRIAPLGGSVVMVHYRRDLDDNDVLVKVLLNGHEARLPIATDCAPYYHWNDVKHYYLRKLYRYENTR